MPELPEVETIANGVHARVHGQRIAGVWTSGKPQTFKSPEAEIADALTGATIDTVRRVGKTIVMTVKRGGAGKNQTSVEFLIHLGMTGRLLVSDRRSRYHRTPTPYSLSLTAARSDLSIRAASVASLSTGRSHRRQPAASSTRQLPTHRPGPRAPHHLARRLRCAVSRA